MTRINASAAGVTATLANDLITLTSNASSEDAIVVPGESIRTDRLSLRSLRICWTAPISADKYASRC
jgi:hypothetical protein